MSKEEYVEVVVKVPKPIMDFLDAWLNFVGSPEYNAEKYLREECEDHIIHHTEEFIAQACQPEFYDGREEAINKYGLKAFIDIKNVGMDLVKSEAK